MGRDRTEALAARTAERGHLPDAAHLRVAFVYVHIHATRLLRCHARPGTCCVARPQFHGRNLHAAVGANVGMQLHNPAPDEEADACPQARSPARNASGF